MSEADVILNELKHIREDIRELKDEFKQTQEAVYEMNGERKLIKWGVPIISGIIAWLFGSRGA